VTDLQEAFLEAGEETSREEDLLQPLLEPLELNPSTLDLLNRINQNPNLQKERKHQRLTSQHKRLIRTKRDTLITTMQSLMTSTM
jgi:cytochrome c peroxidase